MNKVLFSISMLMTFSLSCMANEQKNLDPVVLTDIKVDISIIIGKKPQNMKEGPAIYYSDSELILVGFEEDCYVKVLDGNNVIFQQVVSCGSGSATCSLPNDLKGNYIILLYDGIQWYKCNLYIS